VAGYTSRDDAWLGFVFGSQLPLAHREGRKTCLWTQIHGLNLTRIGKQNSIGLDRIEANEIGFSNCGVLCSVTRCCGVLLHWLLCRVVVVSCCCVVLLLLCVVVYGSVVSSRCIVLLL